MIQKSLRLQKLPPYVFAQIDEKKRALMAQGRDLIDLGIGDPDLPTPPAIIAALNESVKNPENHRYPSYGGLAEFKKACSDWMSKRFSVSLDPKTEIMSLIGSKEGLAHFTEAVVNPGDFTLIPDPSYPVYANATLLAGGSPVYYPLKAENQFKPRWSDIGEEVWKAIKVVYVNFPHNPTSATVSIDTYAELVERAKKYGFIICSDGAYCEQGYQALPPACLQVPGAKEVCIEFFSMSKSYNMTGWRVGFAAGNKDLISYLYQIKSTLDSGVFQPVQWAAIAAMQGNENELVIPSKEVYQYRRKIAVEGLRNLGYQVFDGGATFYLWIQCPSGKTSADTCAELLDAGIVCTPGSGFGKQGEGYFRIALTVSEEKIRAALSRFPKRS